MAVIAVEPVTLVAALDMHFAWMLGEMAAPTEGLRLPPDGVDSPDMLRILRAMNTRLRDAGCVGSWLIVAGNEVVGLCGYKLPPLPDGKVEIGYGVAKGRRGNGYASRAVRAMLEEARRDSSFSTLTAATAIANIVSQRVLERNSFVRTGTTYDPDDGELIWWRRDLFEFYRSA
ncbi:MAG TPA: GNAT family protein [Rhizomicrobium sp.]|jgi:RimJ/RimL family protein N-acetyltransferase